MILGVGIDICDIRRIEETLERFGERFSHKVFTEAERAKCDSRKGRAGSYARRFAAKEAAAKALGTGLAEGVFFKDIGVVNDSSGKPTLALTGGAALQLEKMIPPGKTLNLQVSLSDDFPMAQAIVIISAD
ncbi:MAG: holo-ACP synthase [Caulobacterales bacterium]